MTTGGRATSRHSPCFLDVGPPSLKVQREQAGPLGPKPEDRPAGQAMVQGRPQRGQAGAVPIVLHRCSSLWLSSSVGKLLVKSKLDPLYVMAELDGRAQL